MTHSYLSHEEVKEILAFKVVSSYKVSKFVEQLDNKMDKVLMAFGNQENFHASVLDIRATMLEQVMKLNYEPPYNRWLFELVTLLGYCKMIC